MRKRVVTWVLLGATCFLVVGGVLAYEFQHVAVETGERVVCGDPKHTGTSVISDKRETIWVSRASRGKYPVRVTSTVCPACKARQEEEAREAKERAAAEEAARNVVTAFAVVSNGYYGRDLSPDDNGQWQPSGTTEAQIRPGDEIGFNLQVANRGDKPIRDLKLVIEPGASLAYQPLPPMWEAGADAAAERAFKALTGTGLPLEGPLNPYNDPHYARGVLRWDTSATGLNGHLHATLSLSRSAQPGTDILFHAYLVLNGLRIPAGTGTVHVMFPG